MATNDVTVSLYGGKHTVTFRKKPHGYRIDGQRKRGVTTIMSAVLAKPSLMLWPMNMAIRYIRDNFDGDMENCLEQAAKAHITLRDAGAYTGTEAHAMVEHFLKTREEPINGYGYTEAYRAYVAFVAWFMGHDHWVEPQVISVEQIVYSPQLDYVGTFDSILRIGDKNYLCDLKTTNASREAPQGVYPDNFIQLGAYAQAYNEERTFDIETAGQSDLVQIDDLMIISARKDGKLDTITASQIGLTVAQCQEMWHNTIHLHRSLTHTRKSLAAGVHSE